MLQRETAVFDTLWLTRDEIATSSIDLRHAVVLDIVDQYLENSAVPLSLVRIYEL